MTELDWSRFESLPGDQAANFELLWRGAVRHSYGKHGTFQARAQQPGVEFHLKLDRDCPLGDAGQHFGWQTKWWPLHQAGRSIGATRKSDVKDSLDKTETHLAGLTDWVLCTRRPLAPIDETWWASLSTPFKLEHQVAEDLANLLTGEAELFRQTYFGDLVLTPDRLEMLANLALADVRERWFPEVHQTVPAERTLRRILAEPDAWEHLEVVGSEITTLSAIIEKDVHAAPLKASVQAELDALLNSADTIRQLLVDAHEHLTPGGDHTWRELGEATVPDAPASTPPVLRKLRAANHPAALPCANLVFHTREAATLAKSVFSELAVRCVVVTGDAGYGKTQLAAKLSIPIESRPAGVLLFGRQLRSRDDFDDLAQRVSVNGKKVETFEALLAAVDAAAARAQCRLPIVIDGLNEAEDPTDWKPLLERAQVLLADYPSVLLVCTLRSAFVDRAIPSSLTRSVDLDGFGEDIDQAVEKYFDHFNIDVGGVDLPLERFDHPITLRIFCSVTNPTREHPVQLVGRAPSLNAMFDGYMADAANRIETLANSRIRSTDVHNALWALGVEMWNTNSREVSETRAKEIFGDTNRLWDDSILNALQGEGVLIRQTAQEIDEDSAAPGNSEAVDNREGLVVTVVYDLLAGHIVASGMAATSGATFATSLSTPKVEVKFSGEVAGVHPLAVDIFDALVFVLPQRGLGHLWEHVRATLLDAALLRTTELAPEEVSAGTVVAWEQNLPTLSKQPSFWPRLRSVRAVPLHPLNANFTDKVLRSLSITNRDLTWTEWLRSSVQPHLRHDAGTDSRAMEDLRSWTARWRETDERTEADALRACWFMWMLTSTVRDLRDASTAALYWYGRGDAASLFELAAGALEINDPYVGERATAAAYGVTTAHQQPDAEFGNHLGTYLENLVNVTTGNKAIAPTYHWLIRYYIAGTVEFGRIHYPAVVPAGAVDGIEFSEGHLPDPLHQGDERREEVERTIHMDFGNYTLGRLFPDRANYDYEHEGHRDATDQVLGVIHDLGWRKSEFSSVDQTLGHQDRDRNPGRVDRYGKKYSWIGLQLLTGMMNARGDRVYGLEVDIDPTFPQISPSLPLLVPTWVRPAPAGDRDWLIKGIVKVPDDLMYTETLAGNEGPWVLVHAELDVKDDQTGRGGYGLFNTIVLAPADIEAFMTWWSEKDHPGRDLIELPMAHYLFAGEIPWHTRMVTSGDDIAGTGKRPVAREDDDGWVNPHDSEDPYIDHIRVNLLAAGEAEVSHGMPADELLEVVDDEPKDVAEGGEFDFPEDFEAKTTAHRGTIPPYEELAFESIAHTFAWEGHNSSENEAFAYVPSQRLSLHSGLRSVAAGFDQVDGDGRLAAMSFTAPPGFNGHLLYVREDIVKAYAGDRAVVTFGWGERQIHAAWSEEIPEPLLRVYRAHRNVWRSHRIVAEGQRGASRCSQEGDERTK
ncbi:NACHT domain-containing protein [Arthrobacter sp. 260]|uniref:NACHT domain-containing protein n=1 Tax=Arthrobacter sp. 260 TaxID=2735314 RepID=UPI001490B9E2|nr:NACHT domain-containing protein [Arthrobacter sp. 260]NOJ58430.1 NACHT domain-containing protein [Arthrobacter sp. 260]